MTFSQAKRVTAFVPSVFLGKVIPKRSSSSSRCSNFTMVASPPKQGTATLYVKAAENGEDVGDCPFSMKANLALRFKKVDNEVQVIDLRNKPGWFTDLNSEGTAPTYVAADSKVITSSDDVVQYADQAGKDASVSLCRSNSPHWDAANKVVEPVFSSFISFLKSKGDDEEKCRNKLYECLKAVDDHLQKTGGPYLLGSNLSAVDCNFGPKLFHILVAAKHFKQYEVPSELDHLHEYYKQMSAKPEWSASACDDGTVIWGWSSKIS